MTDREKAILAYSEVVIHLAQAVGFTPAEALAALLTTTVSGAVTMGVRKETFMSMVNEAFDKLQEAKTEKAKAVKGDTEEIDKAITDALTLRPGGVLPASKA